MIKSHAVMKATRPILWVFLATALGCGTRPAERSPTEKHDDEQRQYEATYYAAPASEKPAILRQMVSLEITAGDIPAAKAWVNRGMDERIDAAYTENPSLVLLTIVTQDRAEAAAAQAALEKAAKETEESERKQAAEAERLATATAADAKEKKRIEEEQVERKAEETRAQEAVKQKEQQAAKEAKDALEYDVGGLVLLKDTIKGTYGKFSGEITGTVVNRRNRALKYAQITFNLYDDSGAQIGTALANIISGLEAGGRWNFKAITLMKYAEFKRAELSGF
jgi:hypothetical protein